MVDFEGSNWANESFSRNYLDKADVFIVDRRRMFGIIRARVRHALHGRASIGILDLGAGDGALTEALLDLSPSVKLTVADASEAMLEAARARLSRGVRATFVRGDFETVMDRDLLPGPFDACVSAMAIHHLDGPGKRRLFGYLYDRLSPGGIFVNADALLPPGGALEDFYFTIWKEYMAEARDTLGMTEVVPEDVVKSYLDPKSANRPDTLETQLSMLRDAGYADVDCYYKHGIFAVFGGTKPGP